MRLRTVVQGKFPVVSKVCKAPRAAPDPEAITLDRSSLPLAPCSPSGGRIPGITAATAAEMPTKQPAPPAKGAKKTGSKKAAGPADSKSLPVLTAQFITLEDGSQVR
jgi:hypothetical protein